MLTFLKRLLGLVEGLATPVIQDEPEAAPTRSSQDATDIRYGARSGACEQGASPGGRRTAGDAAEMMASTRDAARVGDAINRYFELSQEIEGAKRDGDFPRAVAAARATYPLLAAVVRQWKREYGKFDVFTSHAVHTAPRLMAVLEDRNGIRELRTVLEVVPELRDWLESADDAEADLAAVPRILAAVAAHPGVVQASLRKQLGGDAGARASNLAYWLERAGRLYRVKKGASYQLYPTGYAIPTAGAMAREGEASVAASVPGSPSTALAQSGPPAQRRRRRAATARPIDLAGLPVVRLPKAPAPGSPDATWDAGVADGADTPGNAGPPRDPSAGRGQRGNAEDGRDGPRSLLAESSQRARATTRKGPKEPRFVVEGEGWALASEERLPVADRPEAAYKEVFPTGRYTHWLDPKGKRVGFEYAAAVLRITDPEGQVIAERGLEHDVYRADVNADGTGILFLSRDGVLHGYTEGGAQFLDERLTDLPEYRAQPERCGIPPRDLKYHTRCVGLAADRSCYLVTVVDEAWCIETATGKPRWGLRMPTAEGWTERVADRSERAGTSAEVQDALRLLGLELPVTPEDITRQYRTLAMRWHPDRNPGDPRATARFQALGAAVELLTGANLSQLSARETEQVSYERVLSTQRVVVPDGRGGAHDLSLTMSMVTGPSGAADWIYAANLGVDGRAFLASYHGKVVVVSPRGIPERVYDVGSVPRHIAEGGEHLYVLTDTRLYVLAGDRLDALADVEGANHIIVGDTGFALIESRAVTWFAPDGRCMGAVRTKDPVRRVHSTATELVVETRQHRARVAGAPGWWRAPTS